MGEEYGEGTREEHYEVELKYKKPYEVIAAVGLNRDADPDHDGARSYASYPALPESQMPVVDDIIAYQKLSLNEETFQPELTAYARARVMSVDTPSGSLQVMPQSEAGAEVEDTQSSAPKASVLTSRWLEPPETEPQGPVELEFQDLANVRIIDGPSYVSIQDSTVAARNHGGGQASTKNGVGGGGAAAVTESDLHAEFARMLKEQRAKTMSLQVPSFAPVT
eukprot:FR742286.1.p1 GENE.FR742286.1~~FR742286.1.p1  ORF type:complete len:230 (+),score=29.26 FR742286.1:27-692(+)